RPPATRRTTPIAGSSSSRPGPSATPPRRSPLSSGRPWSPASRPRSRCLVPSFNAALASQGVQADVNFSGATFNIDGRDNRMADSAGSPTGTANAVFGIATNGSLPMLETQVELALANNQGNTVNGRDETSSSNPPPT